MLNLTRQERLILIFLGFAILTGVALDICFNKIPGIRSTLTSDVIQSSDLTVDINLADKDDFMKIRGIGPVLARRIVDYRASNGLFLDIEDLTLVRGIGQKKLAGMRDFIKIN